MSYDGARYRAKGRHMKIFYLENNKHLPAYFDVAEGLVVVAANEKQAREQAAALAGDEGSGYWLDEAPCTVLGTAVRGQEARVVLTARTAR